MADEVTAKKLTEVLMSNPLFRARHEHRERQKARQRTEFSETMRLIQKIKNQRPRPICAKCNRVVDEFTLDTTPSELFFHFTAYCHGKTQRFDVHKGCIMFADDITIGRAFEDEAAPTMLIDFDSRLLENSNGGEDGSKNA